MREDKDALNGVSVFSWSCTHSVALRLTNERGILAALHIQCWQLCKFMVYILFCSFNA